MKKIFLILSVIYCVTSSGQFRELHFNHLTNKNGLPSGNVSFILEDHEGYIWAGTPNGLVRFDGYNTKTYSLATPGGNSNSDVSQLFEDSGQRLWAGTSGEGLFLYNSNADTFAQYAASTQKGSLLSANEVDGITADRLGNIWVTTSRNTNNFLDCIDTKKHSAIHFGNIGNINTVVAGLGGDVWVGTDKGAYLCKAGTGKLESLASPGRPQVSEGCRMFFEEPRQPGVMWLVTGDYITHPSSAHAFIGVARYDARNGQWLYFRHGKDDNKSIASDTVGAINADKDGNVWLATPRGLSLYSTASQTFSNYQPSKADMLPQYSFYYYGKYGPATLLPTRDSHFWYNIDVELYYFDIASRKFTLYVSYPNEPGGLPLIDPRQILVSRDNTLWAGILGLHWVNRHSSAIARYNGNDTDRHRFFLGGVSGFARAAGNNVWVSSSKGIYQWHPENDSFSKEKALAGLIGYSLFDAIETSRAGKLLISSYPAGLTIYDTLHHTVKRLAYNQKDSNSLPDDLIKCIFEDREGVVWTATFLKDLYSYNPATNKITRYPLAGTGYNLNQCIYGDRQGGIWVGSLKGLYHLDRRTNSLVRFETGNPDFKEIKAILEDSLGRLWVGTASEGVFIIDKDKGIVNRFTTKNGLASDEIYDIAEDALHRYWILSPPGFTIIDTPAFRKLTVKNGFPDLTFSFNGRIFKTGGGLFLVNCEDGFISFNPLDIRTDTTPPVVHIESLRFSNPASRKTVDSVILRRAAGSAVRLKYNENRVTFTYIGLQYQYPEQNTYACRLDGFDKDWVPTGTLRSASYNNLVPGTYTFHVKAANSDGVWGKAQDSITVVILPPWWQTWWAYVLYAAAALSLIWAVTYYRSRKPLRDNRVLEANVKQRTAEVLEQKEEIAAQRDDLEKTLQELQSTQKQLIQSEKMASLGELTAGIAHEIQNPLNFINNFSEVNTELISELEDEAAKGNLEEIKAIAGDLKSNEQKINQHGRRADAIVKGMLQHSRKSAGQKELTDINALADEYLRLSYHGLRAKDKAFNAELQTNFSAGMAKINVVPQDIGRVLLNLYNNAFYAVYEKTKTAGASYQPVVSVGTKREAETILITVADNGNGIPEKIKDKIFQPFFTTKPAGQGTGLGLSLSYDIIKAHGGDINAASTEGEGTTFDIRLPR